MEVEVDAVLYSALNHENFTKHTFHKNELIKSLDFATNVAIKYSIEKRRVLPQTSRQVNYPKHCTSRSNSKKANFETQKVEEDQFSSYKLYCKCS